MSLVSELKKTNDLIHYTNKSYSLNNLFLISSRLYATQGPILSWNKQKPDTKCRLLMNSSSVKKMKVIFFISQEMLNGSRFSMKCRLHQNNSGW